MIFRYTWNKTLYTFTLCWGVELEKWAALHVRLVSVGVEVESNTGAGYTPGDELIRNHLIQGFRSNIDMT